MQIKKKKSNGLTAITGGENISISAKESKAMPVSVSASFGSLKKVPSISVKTGDGYPHPAFDTAENAKENEQLRTKRGTVVEHPTAKDPGHSEAYKERVKKRVK
jgi:hypothetical protein